MGIVVIGAVFVDIKGYPEDVFLPTGRNVGRVEHIHGGVARNVVEDIANCELRPTFVSLVDESGTGADVVRKLKFFLKPKKIGHAGTLDPFATGVLPVALGEATKLLPFVTDGAKEYEFILQFGAETDTDDSDGQIISQTDKIPTQSEIEKVIPSFRGKIVQVPPAYSAIKINGQRAYDLARKGIEVEIPPREIEIYDLKLLEMLPENRARLKVCCSKGTYVRTLGKDIALKTGSKGYLQELRRIKCGNFDLKQKILLENLEKMVYGEHLKEFLLPMETFLCDITVIAVSEADAAKLKMGQALSPKAFDIQKSVPEDGVAVCQGKLVAVVRIDGRRIAPVRVFNL